QDEFGAGVGGEHVEEADALGKLLERKQHGEDGATDGLQLPREAIEFALESTAEGLDALRRPGGQVGEGPRADLVPIAEGFTQEDGRRRASITAPATFGRSAPPDNVAGWHIMTLQEAMKVCVKHFDNFILTATRCISKPYRNAFYFNMLQES